MKQNWSRVRVLVIASLVALSAACSSQLQSPNTEVDSVRTVSLKSVDGRFDVSDTETAIKADTVNYTFSNGQTLSLYAMDQYIFIKGSDTAVALRSELPTWINETENQLNSTSIQPQGVGMSPSALDSTRKSALWPSAKALGVIYYEIGSFPAGIRSSIDQAISQWNATSVGIKWQPRPWGNTYKYATIVGGNNASLTEWVLAGQLCRESVAVAGGGIGYTDPGGFPVGNTIYLNPNCFTSFLSDPSGTIKTVMHEMGHVTGLWHEQQRCQRANYVTVAPNTSPNLIDQIVYIYNAAEKCDLNSANYGYYDFKSIMHYKYDPPRLALRVNGPANIQHCGVPSDAGTGSTLSLGDINAINRLYGRGPVSSNNGC